MNGPQIPHDGPEPGEGSGPDALDRAYQRASAGDASRPGPQVREAILARARESMSAPERLRPRGRSAANDGRWHWRAAAGIATFGLVGLLSWHFLGIEPPSMAARQAAKSVPYAPAAQRTAAPAPTAGATAPQASESAALQMASTAPPAPAPAPAPARAPAPELALATSVAPAPAVNAAAASARLASRAADLTVPAGALGWPDRVRRAVRMLYPELYGAASASGSRPAQTVTIALNADGSVHASSRAAGTGVAPAPADAAALIRESLELAPAELASYGVIASADGVTIVYGIRRPQGANGSGTR